MGETFGSSLSSIIDSEVVFSSFTLLIFGGQCWRVNSESHTCKACSLPQAYSPWPPLSVNCGYYRDCNSPWEELELMV